MERKDEYLKRGLNLEDIELLDELHGDDDDED